VQRDEAKARAREEEEERRMQEADAEQRLRLLRGTDAVRIDAPQSHSSDTHHTLDRRNRKKRRLHGEDDTDRDIRLAREDVAAAMKSSQVLPRNPTNEPLVDHRGHINLFPEDHKRRSGKNEEAEAEAAKMKREYEDQYTMRFSNAAGNKADSAKPWYLASTDGDLSSRDVVSKDVWGNEDPGRRHREEQRINNSDPLAAMKRGVKQLREAKQHRREWMEERERDLYEVEKLARKHRNHRKRRLSEDSLESFNLDDDPQPSRDDPGQLSKDKRRHHGHRRHHSDRHRDGSRPQKHATRRSCSPKDSSS